MSIEKLNHYSMNNPASVYDEEALTALELAGRTATKVNECVDAFEAHEDKTNKDMSQLRSNMEAYKSLTNNTVNEFKDSVTAQLAEFETETIPEVAEASAHRVLDEGTFELQITQNPRKIYGYRVTSKNLFNPDVILKGKYMLTTGEIMNNGSYFVSDYIGIEGGAKYVSNQKLEQVVFYTNDYVYISGITQVTNFTAPDNAGYVMFSNNLSKLDPCFLSKGETVIQDRFTYVIDGLESVPTEHEGSKIKDGSASVNILKGVEVLSSNIVNPADVIEDEYLNSITGLTFRAPLYYTTDFIKVEPNGYYKTNKHIEKLCMYDNNYNLLKTIEGIKAGSAIDIYVNGEYIRFSNHTDTRDIKIYSGEADNYKFTIKGLTVESEDKPVTPDLPGVHSTLYTLGEAYASWRAKKPFDIAFFGDSTTEFTGTTNEPARIDIGETEYINPNSYVSKLQELLTEECEFTPNLINLGFSGHSLSTIKPHLNNILKASYMSDVKMMGISFGINDRLVYENERDYYNNHKKELVELINILLNRGIQPFLMTTQPTIEPSEHSDYTEYKMRDSESINSIANTVKRDLAKEYNLELIDVNDGLSKYIKNSSASVSYFYNDYMHFNGEGHRATAEYIFSQIVPRVITVTGNEIIDFTSQKIRSNVPANAITYNTPYDSFNWGSIAKYKGYVYSQLGTTTSDAYYLDAWIYYDGRKNMTLTPLCDNKATSDPLGMPRAMVNGNYFELLGMMGGFAGEPIIAEHGLYHVRIESYTGYANILGIECLKDLNW